MPNIILLKCDEDSNVHRISHCATQDLQRSFDFTIMRFPTAELLNFFTLAFIFARNNHTHFLMALVLFPGPHQGRRKVWKSEGASFSWPPLVEIGLTDLPKSGDSPGAL